MRPLLSRDHRDVPTRIDSTHDVLDVARLRERLKGLRSTYAAATPFPHLAIDDVLADSVFRAAVAEFPAVDDERWTSYLHVNETKFANPRPAEWGPTLRAIAEALCGDEFVSLLGELTGIEQLVADPTMDGGGLHQTLRGGHLNVHADFTVHHRRPDWRRRINILLYLNPAWDPAWGGSLELWDSDVKTCVQRIAPFGNRMVIFTTSEDSYHGHPDPLRCPAGIARQSLALYYFTQEDRPVRRATAYRPRPGDGIKGLAIWADRGALRTYDALKTRLGLSDRAASGLLNGAHRAIGRLRRSR